MAAMFRSTPGGHATCRRRSNATRSEHSRLTTRFSTSLLMNQTVDATAGEDGDATEPRRRCRNGEVSKLGQSAERSATPGDRRPAPHRPDNGSCAMPRRTPWQAASLGDQGLDPSTAHRSWRTERMLPAGSLNQAMSGP